MKMLYMKNGDVVEQIERINSIVNPNLDGGPDAFLFDLLKYNPDVTFLLLSFSRRSAFYAKDKIKAKVIKTSDINQTIIGKIYYQISSVIISLFSIILFRPDRIVCGRVGPQLWLAFLLSRVLFIPLIHSRHNSVEEYNPSWHRMFVFAFENWILRRISAVICHGPYLVDQLHTIAGVDKNNIHEFDVGYKSYLASSNSPLAAEKDIDNNDSVNIFYIGRLSRNKGIFDLLKSFSNIKKTNSLAHLFYIGNGEDKEILDAMIVEMELGDSVILLGYCTMVEISALLKRAYILVAPTRKEFPEGRCMVLMEAFVMGVPVIAPDYGPFPYLVEHDINGYLYEPNSVDDLTKYLDIAISNKSEYSKIRQGAKQTGAGLMVPGLSFSQAVNRAFSKVIG